MSGEQHQQQLGDVRVMEMFMSMQRDVADVKAGQARMEETLLTLKGNQNRCNDHAIRLRENEKSVTSIKTTLKVVWAVIGISLPVVAGVLIKLAF